jgi:L-phenylalanine/L-methionine N-acetyltransferase
MLPPTIRRATVDDAAAFARILGEPAVQRNLMQLPYTSEPIWRTRLAEMTAPGRGDLLLVAEQTVDATPRVLATAGLHPVSVLPRLRHAAMLGISVAGAAQRQGVGAALMQAMCDYADRWMQVQRLQLDVYVDNAPAIALYRRFGFEHEATQRAYALRDGVYVDSYSMARMHPQPPSAALQAGDGGRPAGAAAAHPQASASGNWTLGTADADDVDGIAALMSLAGVVEDLLLAPLTPPDAVRKALLEPPRDCAIVARSEGRVIGYAGLTVQAAVRRRHAAALVACVAPAWQRRGIGRALVAALVDWADRWAGLLRLELGVLDGNVAGLALARRFGFVHEGTQRAAVLREGAFVDQHLLARLHPSPPQVPAQAQA